MTITSDKDVVLRDVRLVATPGRHRPTTFTHAQVLHDAGTVTLTSALPVHFEAGVGDRRPCVLSCLTSTDGVDLRQPPWDERTIS